MLAWARASGLPRDAMRMRRIAKDSQAHFHEFLYGHMGFAGVPDDTASYAAVLA